MNSRKRCWHLGFLGLISCALNFAPAVSAAVSHDVSLGDDFFSPNTLTIDQNDQVKWTWVGFHDHTVTSDGGLWDTGQLPSGSTFTRTFTTAGSFPYRCTIHSLMTASLTVRLVGPQVTIASPANGANLSAPATFTLRATAVDSDGAITSVQFFKGANLLTNLTASPYLVRVSSLPVGNYNFSARATDSLGRKATNSIVVHVIPDVIRPISTIGFPAADQRVTNTVAQITVKGQASDDVQVTNVQFQLNGGEWTGVFTTNSWANWTETVTPAPGTNTIRAFATDFSGNYSLTNRRSFFYVVKAPLIVSATGQGTISPNYSNALLEIGRTFTVTASPTNGHKFINWILSTNGVGGVANTNATLRFLMVSNLALQANFLDVKPPNLSITFPASGQRITNTAPQVTVQGRASDNVLVTNVQYQLNGGAWIDALPVNTFTNWTATLTPRAGTNIVAAFSTDATGYKSATNRVTFIYVVRSTLTLITNGIGSITHGFVGNQLEVGRAYTVTAVPGAGQVFSNWVGDATSSSAVLQFIMRSNMFLQANIIPNPFLRAQGIYNGLFAEPVRVQDRSGFFTLTLADHGAFSAALKVGTNTFSFSGQFDLSGSASKLIDGVLVNLNLDLVGAEKLTGTVGTADFTADILANRYVFNSVTNPASRFKGTYTVILPGAANSATLPAGHGFGTVTVGPGGFVTLSGTLGDNFTWSQNVPISRDGQWPCYVPLYGGLGSIWGWLLFDTNQPAAEINGAVSWIRPPRPGALYYPLGFTNDLPATGSRYTAPTNATTRVIDLTNGVVIFDGGNLSAPFTNLVTLTSSNRLISGSPNSLSFSITKSNGLFSGSVKVPGTTRTNTFKGAFLQDLDSGYGYFLGTNQSGSVFLGPQP